MMSRLVPPSVGRLLRLSLWLLAMGLLMAQTSPGTSSAPGPGSSNSDQASNANPLPTPTGRVAPPSGGNVAIITLEDMIDSYSLLGVERRVERAIAGGASIIVFEINTDGGDMFVALDLSKYIKSLQSVRTIAWINNKAYSAGIVIASACDDIIMSPASATGDTLPIMMFAAELGEKERAKALAPLLAELRDNARRNGYDYALFHAMADTGIELYLIEHKQTGQRRLVNQIDYAVMVQGDNPAGKLRIDPNQIPQDDDELVRMTLPSLNVATEADRGQWQPVEQLDGLIFPQGRVHDGSVPFTVNQTEAKVLGLSDATLATPEAVAQYLKAGAVVYVNESWSEHIADFLMNIWVRGLLLAIMLVGFFIEFNSPGVGFFGLAGLIAMSLLIGAPYIAGVADIWHIVLFLLGVVLLVIEIIFIPSFGILGVVGLVFMFIGLVLSVIPTTPSSPGFGPIRLPAPTLWNQTMLSAVAMLAGIGVAIAVLIYFVRQIDTLPMFKRLILQEEQPRRMRLQPKVAGAMAGGAGVADAQSPEEYAMLQEQAAQPSPLVVGVKGIAQSPLRPGGLAMFSGRSIDVVLDNGMAEPGDAVRVTEVHGNVVTVEKV